MPKSLTDFFKENRKIALGFSGGVDSSYLLWAALNAGAEVTAYYVKTVFQPQFEYEDAKKLAKQLGANMKTIEFDVLTVPNVPENPSNRCYYCKIGIFSLIKEAAIKDGFKVLIDGTNASDDADDRPGMKALNELEVCSPLRECGLTKTKIRELSKGAGLFTWDKPAYACLATRIPAGTRITAEDLLKIENAEDYLFSQGFSDFRVRSRGDMALLQLPENQFEILINNRKEIYDTLNKSFRSVSLDLKPR